MIAVSQDAEGIRLAALELMEESLDAPERERALRAAELTANPEETMAKIEPQRKLSVGYYLWLQFIVEAIETPLEYGVGFREADLAADELAGLLVVRNARAEFRREHPPCRGCGRPLAYSWEKTCNDCQRAEAQARKRD